MHKKTSFSSLVLVLILSLTLSIFTVACQEHNENSDQLNVVALKGPTALGLLQMMDQKQDQYKVELQGAPDAVVPLIMSGKADVACIPANLASVLYNKTEGKVKVIGLNTLGVLYLVENGDTVHSWEDLKGKTVISSGKGAVPEYLFRQVLEQNGLTEDDLNVEYKSDHSAVLADLSSGKADIAVLPQPFLTVAQSKLAKLRVVFDLSEESDTPVVMGVYVASASALADKPAQLKSFLADAKSSVDFVNANPEEAGKLSEKFDVIAPASVATKAIPECALVCISDLEKMQDQLLPFLGSLYAFDAKTVGGKLPTEDIFLDFK